MPGYGLVGCGYSGEIHGDNVMRLPGARLVQVYDVDFERRRQLARRYGAKEAGSMEELCQNPLIDAIIIATPNNSHVFPAVCGAKHGKHIFCEKPVALCLEDAEEMLCRSKEANVLLFAAHTTNFIRGVQTAKRLIERGEIGRIIMIEAVHTDWAGPQNQVGWKQRKEISGGHLYHHMHEAELICQLAGLPHSVCTQGRNLVHSGPGFGNEEDAMMLLMEWEEETGVGRMISGGMASLTIGSSFHLGDHVIKIQGEKGGICLDFKNSLGTLVKGKHSRVFCLQENQEEDQERRDGYRNNRQDAGKGFGRPGMKTSEWMKTIFYKELCCFDQVIQTGMIAPEFASLIDGTAAVNCMKLLDGAMESMAKKKRVILTK
ncbi:MAG: Gfo/Idh/MocA family oxidoreductase [Lachnospiraceae bacterium]|nr:Gfo/Idh/MocA family oxidoreductase [Lachnospiraceae bacterium]